MQVKKKKARNKTKILNESVETYRQLKVAFKNHLQTLKFFFSYTKATCHMYCYLKFKLRYLKKHEIVFNKSKVIIQTYSFAKERQRDLLLFKNIFLRN